MRLGLTRAKANQTKGEPAQDAADHEGASGCHIRD